MLYGQRTVPLKKELHGARRAAVTIVQYKTSVLRIVRYPFTFNWRSAKQYSVESEQHCTTKARQGFI